MSTPPSPPVAKPAPPRPSLMRRFWGFIMFLLVVGAGALAAYDYRLLQKEQAARAELEKAVAAWEPKFEAFKGAVREVDRHMSSVVFQEIDLGAAGWQPIAGGFYVIDLGVAAHAKGVKIAGKIINPTSVTHEQAQFSLRIGEHKSGFVLPRVPPGVAQPFELVLPELSPSEAKRGYLALESSTISFASSTTRKGPATGPVDTDKLLK
jgi:hypothetical protein